MQKNSTQPVFAKTETVERWHVGQGRNRHFLAIIWYVRVWDTVTVLRSVMWSETVGFIGQDRSETKQFGLRLGLARCGLGLGLAHCGLGLGLGLGGQNRIDNSSTLRR